MGIIRTWISNYRYWRDKPTREYASLLAAAKFEHDMQNALLLAHEHLNIPDINEIVKSIHVSLYRVKA